MKDKIKYYSQKCFEYIVTHTVWYLITTGVSALLLNIPALISFLSNANTWFTELSNHLSIISICLLVVSIIILLLVFSLYKNLNKTTSLKQKSTHTNNDKPAEEEPIDINTEISNDNETDLISKIHFKKVVISIKFHSCSHIEYTMKFDGYATTSEIDDFEKQLVWSGTKYISTELVSYNVAAHIDDNIGNRSVSPYIFRICFDEDISVNDKIKFTTKTHLSDEAKCVFPISSFCVQYPIDELVLKLSAPIGLVHTVRKKCYKDASRQKQVFSSENIDQDEVEGYKIYTYPINNPCPWLFYALEWKFSEQY